jgi:ribosome-associated toxin RatA of RatAB toxin-antitoxin module
MTPEGRETVMDVMSIIRRLAVNAGLRVGLPALLLCVAPLFSHVSGAARAGEESSDLSGESADLRETTGTPANEVAPEDHADVSSKIFIPARPDSVWMLLTDYDHLREYVPNMVESRLLEDHGSVKLIEQVGRGRWFFFGKKARVVLEVEEHKYSRLDFHVVDGDFNVFDGSWQLYPRKGGTLLTYSLSVKPKFFVPGFVVKSVLSHDVPQKLVAIRDRIESQSVQLAGAAVPNVPTGASK